MGDEIMVTGQAKKLQSKLKNPVVVFDRNGRIRSHEMWFRNPRILTTWDRKSAVHPLNNGPGVRPYIHLKTERQWIWKDFECTPGEIYFNEGELQVAANVPKDFVIVEPNNKPKASPNKDWGWDRWQALVYLLKAEGIRVAQMGDYGMRMLSSVAPLHTGSFREACAVLARARAAVLPEGGLHHAAAAVGVPAVVVYGGYISPRQTGYQLHRNLFTGGDACGWRVQCKHCEKALAEITPEMVVRNLMEIVNDRETVSGV